MNFFRSSRPLDFFSHLAVLAGLCVSGLYGFGCKSEERAPSTKAEAAGASATVAAASSATGASPGASSALPNDDAEGLAQTGAGTAEPSAAPTAVPIAEASPLGSSKVAVVPTATASAKRPKGEGEAKPPKAEPAPPIGSVAAPSTSAAPAASFDAPPPAAPNSADAVAEKVDAIYLPIERFSARFEQKYTAKIAGTTKNSDGVCYIKRPGKVSFSYHTPNKNRVVSDGVTLKIYEAENQQMFTRSVASTEYPGALAFILGKGLRHSFNFAFNESAKWEGGPVLVGTPRVPNPGYEKVLFYIDEELLKKGDPACVRRVLVIDAQGNRNRFDFLHVEQPQTIPDTEFEFTPPEGTNVLQ